MSISEKLVTIASNQTKVYDAGKQAEYDNFWDVFQNNGNPTDYSYAFAYNRFNDTTYNPKYDIKISLGRGMFEDSPITDTKVGVYATDGVRASNLFQSSSLKTIRLLYVDESITSFANLFADCSELENITMGGTICANIIFSACTKLTHDSLMSIIEHLGTVTSTKKCTLGSTNLEKLTDAEKAIATQKGWTLA